MELFSASPLSLDNSRKRLLYIKLPDGPQHVQKQRYQTFGIKEVFDKKFLAWFLLRRLEQ